MKTVFDYLQADHNLIRDLFEEVDTLLNDYPHHDEEKEEDLIEEIVTHLRAHTSAEEQTFYTALKGKDDQSLLVFEAYAEHELTDHLLQILENETLDFAERAAKLKVLKEMVLHHLDEEEDELFNFASKHLSNDEQERLAREFIELKSQL